MVTRYTKTGAIEIRKATLTVPSDSGHGTYTLTLDAASGEAYACTCPHFEHRQRHIGKTCKHIDRQRNGAYSTIKPHLRVRPVPAPKLNLSLDEIVNALYGE